MSSCSSSSTSIWISEHAFNMATNKSVSVSSVSLAPSSFLDFGVLETLQGILDLTGEETPWGHEDDGLLVYLNSGRSDSESSHKGIGYLAIEMG